MDWKTKKRVSYCDIRAFSHSCCDVFFVLCLIVILSFFWPELEPTFGESWTVYPLFFGKVPSRVKIKKSYQLGHPLGCDTTFFRLQESELWSGGGQRGYSDPTRGQSRHAGRCSRGWVCWCVQRQKEAFYCHQSWNSTLSQGSKRNWSHC